MANMIEEGGDNFVLNTHCRNRIDADIPVLSSLVDPIPVKKPYKATYPPSLDSQIKKLRVMFETWKDVVLPVKSVLLWEKQWYPWALLGGSTIFFTLFWLIDPSFMTAVCALGLILVLSDYFVPPLVNTLLKNGKWTSHKEKELDEICVSLTLYKTKFDLMFGHYYRMRNTNPKLYVCVTASVLAFLAWMGSIFNNLFLLYVTVTTLLLIPGMENHGMLRKITASAKYSVTSLLDNAKSKLNSDIKSKDHATKKIK